MTRRPSGLSHNLCFLIEFLRYKHVIAKSTGFGHCLVPPFILRSPHQRLAVVGSCGTPAEDIGWIRKLAGISCDTNSMEPGDELLIKVSAQCEWGGPETIWTGTSRPRCTGGAICRQVERRQAFE